MSAALHAHADLLVGLFVGFVAGAASAAAVAWKRVRRLAWDGRN